MLASALFCEALPIPFLWAIIFHYVIETDLYDQEFCR